MGAIPCQGFQSLAGRARRRADSGGGGRWPGASLFSRRPLSGTLAYMRVSRLIHVLDAADLDAESSFWAGFLDGTVDAEEDWHSVLVDGVWRLGVQLAPNHVAPEWPDGSQQQQIHLDVWVDDLSAAHDRATFSAQGY
jgi:hypothetical protein